MSAPMLEVRHLRLVRAIADEGGPTRAAARLHLTQSAISHQLAELEGRMGLPLFARIKRRLVPTPAGARLVEEARKVLSELARIERDIHRIGEPRREVVRIVTEVFTSYHWLPPIVAEFAREAPHVEIRIALHATREPLGALSRGGVDVALVSSPTSDRSLMATPLFDDEWTVILPPGHGLAGRSWISVKDLAKQTLFTHEAPRHDVERMRDLMASEHATMPRVALVALTDVMVGLVRAGLGLAVVSRWAVRPWLDRGELVARRLTRGGLPEQWRAMTRRDAGSNVAIQRFLTLLRASATLSDAPRVTGKTDRRPGDPRPSRRERQRS